MSAEIKKIASCDGKHELAVYCFVPENPRAILQVVHGMAEHMGRYEAFARFLNENGVALIGHDHLGHGRTARDASELGFIAEKGGADLLINDAIKVTGYIKETYGEIPVVLFGHSMGSLIARNYISRQSDNVVGCILCGNVQDTFGFAGGLTQFIAALRGKKKVSKLLDDLAFGSYLKRIENPKTSFDWLSVNEENVKKYIEDEFSGFGFKAQAMSDLARLNANVSGTKWIKTIRKDLPIFLFSGEDDPCGGWGEGVKKIYGRLCDEDIESVSLTLYPGLRHEILQEKEAPKVMGDMLSAIDEITEE